MAVARSPWVAARLIGPGPHETSPIEVAVTAERQLLIKGELGSLTAIEFEDDASAAYIAGRLASVARVRIESAGDGIERDPRAE